LPSFARPTGHVDVHLELSLAYLVNDDAKDADAATGASSLQLMNDLPSGMSFGLVMIEILSTNVFLRMRIKSVVHFRSGLKIDVMNVSR
jgi:hypothetical protein